MGCDPPHSSWLRARRLISIHASRMGCDYTPTHYRLSTWYFNPRIPYGMRPTQLAICVANVDFNPRIPYGMRRHSDHAQGRNHGFQSTHPVWDATARATFPATSFLFQSTHPVWDATTGAKSATSVKSRFQSTHPVWDATTLISCPNNSTKFQSTHPVWDATRRHNTTT